MKIKVRLNNFEREYALRSLGELHKYNGNSLVGYIDNDICNYELENMNLEIYIRDGSDSTITVFNKSLNVSKLMQCNSTQYKLEVNLPLVLLLLLLLR